MINMEKFIQNLLDINHCFVKLINYLRDFKHLFRHIIIYKKVIVIIFINNSRLILLNLLN